MFIIISLFSVFYKLQTVFYKKILDKKFKVSSNIVIANEMSFEGRIIFCYDG